VDAPDTTTTAPEFPLTDDPELSSTDPDTPADSTGADTTTTDPVPELALVPDVRVTLPPTPAPAFRPAITDMFPPCSKLDKLEVSPAESSTEPPDPSVADPEANVMPPAYTPVPVRTESEPTTPELLPVEICNKPESNNPEPVANTMSPVDPAVALPETTDTAPLLP